MLLPLDMKSLTLAATACGTDVCHKPDRTAPRKSRDRMKRLHPADVLATWADIENQRGRWAEACCINRRRAKYSRLVYKNRVFLRLKVKVFIAYPMAQQSTCKLFNFFACIYNQPCGKPAIDVF